MLLKAVNRLICYVIMCFVVCRRMGLCRPTSTSCKDSMREKNGKSKSSSSPFSGFDPDEQPIPVSWYLANVLCKKQVDLDNHGVIAFMSPMTKALISFFHLDRFLPLRFPSRNFLPDSPADVSEPSRMCHWEDDSSMSAVQQLIGAIQMLMSQLSHLVSPPPPTQPSQDCPSFPFSNPPPISPGPII